MNPITLMLLTVVANALVTGIIVYLIQKRIERSYTRQMEEFKASLQYSNFEQQTKFAKIHEKRVETLETLYQKYSLIRDSFREIIGELNIAENKYKMEGSKYSPHRELLDDFRFYFETNRLFLTPETSGEINEICLTAERVNVALRLLFVEHEKTSEAILWANAYLHDLRNVDILNPKKPNYTKLLSQMYRKIQEQTQRLETIYKSVADTADK
jgi:hypothetical protein